MVLDKVGEEWPEDEQEIKERLLELKQEYLSLVERGAPTLEVEEARDKAARLELWRTHLESLRDQA